MRKFIRPQIFRGEWDPSRRWTKLNAFEGILDLNIFWGLLARKRYFRRGLKAGENMRRFLLYGVFPLLLISQGCTMVTAVAPAGYDVVSHYGFAASGAYMTARGGYGEITIIRPVQGLGTYTQIKFQPFESTIGEKISPELLKYLNNQIFEEVHNIEFEKPGGKTLLIRGKVIHLFEGVLEKYIVANVELLDADTHKSLGVANIEGRSEGIHTMKAAAEGLAGGITKLLERHRKT